MSTSSRPRPAGVRASAAAVLAALTVTGASLITAPAAVAAPGDPDVVIHKVGFPFDNQRNQPLVCDFYLSAFNFPEDTTPSQRISWTIDSQSPASAADPIAAGEITLAADGTGHSKPVAAEYDVRLPEGRYTLTWRTVGGALEEGLRSFTVDCPSAGPHGGPPAGGGGLAMTQDFAPVAGAATVGFAAVGGVAYLRLRRRRADGAA
ncbi:hypothetical protein [Streptomyces sp. DSM 40750]|uniref:hypothetical protein n=1 Tax=Streptomyces sp. DSM 40750 TaxID=2801030 RepID=UPI00214B61A3|nr:hypothetical protein [Streptomyces sp. DSM 40750]UUU20902.1 hypothetical protein JIX55_11625 [Streptomyces sp. DSM 40750]